MGEELFDEAVRYRLEAADWEPDVDVLRKEREGAMGVMYARRVLVEALRRVLLLRDIGPAAEAMFYRIGEPS